jgi:hypothetical protein
MKSGKQLLITSIACVIFFAIGMFCGGWIIWKQFRADQIEVKKKIEQIERENRLAMELERILSNLTEELEKF